MQMQRQRLVGVCIPDRADGTRDLAGSCPAQRVGEADIFQHNLGLTRQFETSAMVAISCAVVISP
ncbi:MAG: hypothetical protein JWS10_3783 [Cypionkella sp.]|uniref:hypothetical protein n=1 Tax=Cypionkella sp. TaxID=2811411 RepID=UPI0026100406|nr:hypothetical protein [Cypionkella sp.]MDB5661168.1 hypothetical protein [Cypionkella sp.]